MVSERDAGNVLVFTGGGQTMAILKGTLEADWRKEAERRGYDEALFIDYMGNIKEGATTNIFAIRDVKGPVLELTVGGKPEDASATASGARAADAR